jgi:hypothetical protein
VRLADIEPDAHGSSLVARDFGYVRSDVTAPHIAGRRLDRPASLCATDPLQPGPLRALELAAMRPGRTPFTS